MGAISVLQTANTSSTASSGASSVNFSFGSAISAGQQILVIIAVPANNTTGTNVTDSLGNTYTKIVDQPSPDGNSFAVFFCSSSSAGSPTITVTNATGAAGQGPSIIGFVVSGVASVAPVDVNYGKRTYGTTAAPVTGSGPGTAWANELVLGVITVGNATGADWTAFSGYTIINAPGGYFVDLAVMYKTVTTTQANTGFSSTGGVSNYYNWASQISLSDTPNLSPPTVTTLAASAIDKTIATANGNITNMNGATPTKRGVVYGTSSVGSTPGNVAPGSTSYTTYSEESGSFSTGAFTRNLTGLTKNTTYYYRSYAQNSEGYAYGPQVSFTTLPGTPLIDAFSATDAGFVNIDDGSDSDPFYRGDTIRYTAQSPLPDGTYYYRVRVKDPNGSNTWSSWSATQTFIVANAIAHSKTPADTGTATDTPAKRLQKYGIGDTATATDAATKRPIKLPADSVTPSDALTTKRVQATKTDSVTPTDAPSKRYTTPKTDSVTAVDASIRTPRKLPADSVTATDAVTGKRSQLLKPDSVTPADVNTKRTTKLLADNVTTSDSRGSTHSKTATDSVSATDTFGKTLRKLFADTVTIIESSAIFTGIVDTVTAIDQVIKRITATKQDVATASDAQSKKSSKYPLDAVTAVESAVKRSIKQPADTATVTDAPSKRPGPGANDTITPADATAKAFATPEADSTTPSDQPSLKPGKTPADEVWPIDMPSKRPAKRPADAVTPTDLARKRPRPRKTDSVTATDSVVKRLTKLVQDIVSPTDNMPKAITLPFADIVSIADTVGLRLARFLSDTVTVTESARPGQGKQVDELLTATDTARLSLGLRKNDTAPIVDAVMLRRGSR